MADHVKKWNSNKSIRNIHIWLEWLANEVHQASYDMIAIKTIETFTCKYFETEAPSRNGMESNKEWNSIFLLVERILV